MYVWQCKNCKGSKVPHRQKPYRLNVVTTADEQISSKPSYIFGIFLTRFGTNALVDIRDGFDTAAPRLLRIAAVQDTTFGMELHRPIIANTGIFVDLNSSGDIVSILWNLVTDFD